MDKKYFSKLLAKYMQGEASAEEIRFLESYYELFENTDDVLKTFSKEEKSRLRDDIRAGMGAGNAVAPWYALYKKEIIAAAAVIIIFSGVFILYHPAARQQPFAENKRNGVFAHIVAKADKEHGQNRVIALPDGSAVILSAGSALDYSKNFNIKTRDVFLNGEAFFDVQHNASKPFVVHTGKVQVTVLGTAFNVKAINGEKNITVTVRRGRVRVSDDRKVIGEIMPSQQIVYNKESITAQTQTVANEDYLGWQGKALFIDNLTIAEASKILEDKYHTVIQIKDREIEALRFTATFSADDDIDKALNSICVFNGINYRYANGGSVIEIYK
ncbi:FecR family protein [Parafilimonas sp.]|uniref:FecR family protein n=1 Tax=Parafilimonas sp. TaxID=1969739 RepID=UPI0039E474EF